MDILVPLTVFLCLLVVAPLSFLLSARIALARRARQTEQAQAELLRAMQSAALAAAEIVSVRTLASRQSDGALVARLTLRVSPPEGEPYTAFSTWEVDLPAAGILAPGQTVAVRVSPADPAVVYPNVSWARPSVWE